MFDYENKLDTKFDAEFKKLGILKWLPWVGKKFRSTSKKTYIIGESMKNWNPENKNTQERIKDKNLIRDIHIQFALNPEANEPHIRNIEKAILNTGTPNREKVLNLWDSVIFHNLVLRSMSSIDERPSYNDYSKGWKSFLNIITVTGCDQCIMYGTDRKKSDSFIEILKELGISYQYKQPYGKTNRAIPRVVLFEFAGKEIKILFIKHPSKFFTWGEWSGIIKEQLDLKSIG